MYISEKINKLSISTTLHILNNDLKLYFENIVRSWYKTPENGKHSRTDMSTEAVYISKDLPILQILAGICIWH